MQASLKGFVLQEPSEPSPIVWEEPMSHGFCHGKSPGSNQNGSGSAGTTVNTSFGILTVDGGNCMQRFAI
jgi:hypothetical protein